MVRRESTPTRERRPPLDVADAAIYVGTTERHLRRLVSERRIPFLKLAGSKIRFLPDDLDQCLDAQRVEEFRRRTP
jgi:excisionase family DNA binding protein